MCWQSTVTLNLTCISTQVSNRRFLCAAAFLGGLIRMSASMSLILMEMTGAPNTLPFLMLVNVIAKGVGDRCVCQLS
jgi:H+/Cl- antiporter ClcA